MKTLDEYIHEAIERYHRLIEHTEKLGEQIQDLTPSATAHHCALMDDLRKEIVDNDTKLHKMLDFLGSDVLNNPLVSSYQQALAEAISATDRVAARARLQKSLLLEEIGSTKHARRAVAGYSSGTQQKNILQKVG